MDLMTEPQAPAFAPTPIFEELVAEQADGGIRTTAPVVEPDAEPPASPDPAEDPLVASADPAMVGDE